MHDNACCNVCGCPRDAWLAVKLVAGQLGVCSQTVHNLILRGKIKALKVGRQWRIRHSSLDDYMRRQEETESVAIRA